MNGANHQNEFESQPFYICPICLHKLYIARALRMRYDKVDDNNNNNNEEQKQNDNDGHDKNDKYKAMRKRMAARQKKRKQQDKNIKAFNLVERYHKLHDWCKKTGLLTEAEWYKQRLIACDPNSAVIKQLKQ